MEAEFDTFKLHDNLLNLKVEKFKATLGRLLPSRRKPTRSKLLKTSDEHCNNENFNPNASACPIETSMKKIENENSPTDFAASPIPLRTTTAVSASGHQSPSASPPQYETLSQSSFSDENLTSVDDKNENSDSHKCTSKSKWSFQHTKSLFKKPFRGGHDFPAAKSELENVLQRVLRSKGQSFSNKAQQNTTSKEIRPKTPEPTVYPKRISFVTAESLRETKQRLRHLDDFNRFDSQIEVSSNSSTGGGNIEVNDGISQDVHDESDAAVTSGCSLTDLEISSSDSTTKSDCKLHDFQPINDLSLEKAIFSDVQPVTNLSFDNGIRQSAELEVLSTSIRELTAQVLSHQDDIRIQKTEPPPLLPKGADIFELLRRFEKRAADEAAAAAKPSSKPDDHIVTPAKVINDSWIRTTRTSPVQLDVSASSTTSIASSTSWSTTPFKTRAWEVETPHRGRILETLESLRQSSTGSDFETHSQLLRRSNDSQEIDALVKQHSIALDDIKPVASQFADTYVVSKFYDELPGQPVSNQLTTAVDDHVAEALPLVTVETSVPTTDIKQLKRVQFGKTEEHFAAVQQGEMKIVEAYEKPPPTLYRHKKRSVSASPKMLGISSSYSKLGDYKGHIEAENTRKFKFPTTKRFNAPNLTHTSHTWPEDSFSSIPESKTMVDLLKASSSTTSDAESAVPFSPMRPGLSNIRRVSSSIFDENESSTASAGYSTEIDFENDVTDITDTEPRGQRSKNESLKFSDEEILDKSHFNHSSIEEEMKTINSDTKHAKITSTDLNVQDVRPEDTIIAAKKFATALLNFNDTKKVESTQVPPITGAHDSNLPQRQDILRSRPRPEHVIPHRMADDRHCSLIYTDFKDKHANRTPDTYTSKSSRSRAKTDHRPVTIIHHGVRLPEKRPDSRRSVHHTASSTPKSELAGSKSRSRNSESSSKEVKEPRYMMGVGASLHKKISTTTSSASKERLIDSGRDGWLNLPKECKSTTSSSTAERKEPTKSMNISQPHRTGGTPGSDVDSKRTLRGHHSSRLPTPCSFRKSRKLELVGDAGTAKINVTDVVPSARSEISCVTYRDASDKDLVSHQIAYQKHSKQASVSKKSGLRLFDQDCRGTPCVKIRGTSTTDVPPSAKLSVARNPSNSLLGSRSNSHEFKYPVLKTEERSKQRAARILQRAASREALIKRGHIGSSENITFDKDKCRDKAKPSRKVISTKMAKPEATSTRTRAPPRSEPRNTKNGSISSRSTQPMR